MRSNDDLYQNNVWVFDNVAYRYVTYYHKIGESGLGLYADDAEIRYMATINEIMTWLDFYCVISYNLSICSYENKGCWKKDHYLKLRIPEEILTLFLLR